jgi:hypothetical protein
MHTCYLRTYAHMLFKRHVPTLEQRLQSLQSAWLAKAARSELAAAHLHLPLAAGAPLTPDLHLLQAAAADSGSC